LIEAATLRAPATHVVLVSPDSSPEMLKRAMRVGVRDILPAPMSAATVQRAVDYVQASRSVGSRYHHAGGSVLAFVPIKGGVGNTFLATNLAYALARKEKKVLLVDLNLYFGDAAMFVTDRKPTASVVDMMSQTGRMDAALLNSCVLKVREDLHLLAAPTLPYEVNRITPDTLDNFLGMARWEYDFVILDISRTLEPVAVKALDVADVIYLTVALSLPAIEDANRVSTVLQGLGYPDEKVRLIVNRYEKRGLIALEQVEKATRVKVKRTIPASETAVLASINQGVPLLKMEPKDPVSRALADWADELAPVLIKHEKGWFHSMLGGL
jgi:pilus assembly protein CpaE